MRKPVKVGLIVAGVFLVLVVAVALALPMLLNVDALKSMGEDRASELLGREVRIADAGFALWTGPRVQLKGFSISESEGFGDDPFASFSSFDLRVRLLPLLRGRLEVIHILLMDPELRIVRDAAGRWNFTDITERLAFAAVAVDNKDKGKRNTGRTSDMPVSMIVETIRMEKGAIYFRDGTNDQLRNGLTVRPVDLEISNLAVDRPISLSASVGLFGKGADLFFTGEVGPVGKRLDPADIPLDLHLEVPNLDLSALNDLITDLPYTISGTVQMTESLKGTLGSGLRVDLKARMEDFGLSSKDGNPFVHDLSCEMVQEGMLYPADFSIQLDKLLLKTDSFTYEAKGTAKNLVGIPTVDFSFSTNSIPLKSWIRYFPDLEKRIKASGDLAISGSMKGTPNRDLTANVEAVSNQLEIDRGPMLLEEKGESGEGSGEPVDIKEIIPPNLPLSVTAKLSIKEGRSEWVSYSDFTARVSASEKQISLDSMALTAFGGRITGSSWINMGESPPAYGSDVKINSIDFDKFLTAFAGLEGVLYGKLTADMLVSGVGNSIGEFKKSVIGVGSFHVDQGRFTPANILSEAGAAASLLGIDSEGDETEFERMGGHFTVSRGKVLVSDLVVSTPGWSANASGDVGLDQTLNMSWRIAPGRSLEEKIPSNRRDLFPKDEKGRLQIPLRIRGKLTSPKYSLDTDAMKKAVKERVKRKVEEERKKLEKDLGEKLKKDLGDALKKLF